MLFAVKCSRDINEYVEYHKDFGDGLEFFKPRARDYALLRINQNYRLALERDDFRHDDLEFIESAAALKRLKSFDHRNGLNHQTRAHVLDTHACCNCHICYEADRTKTRHDCFEDYVDAFVDHLKEYTPPDPALIGLAVEILAQALESGWRPPHDDGPTDKATAPAAQTAAKTWGSQKKRLAVAAVEDALGWLLALSVLGDKRSRFERPRADWIKRVDRDRLRHAGFSWCLERKQEVECGAESRLRLFAGVEDSSRLIVIEGTTDQLRDVMASLFLDIAEVRSFSVKYDQIDYPDSQDGFDNEFDDEPEQFGDAPRDSAEWGQRVGFFFESLEAAKITVEDNRLFDVIGVPLGKGDALKAFAETQAQKPTLVLNAQELGRSFEQIELIIAQALQS